MGLKETRKLASTIHGADAYQIIKIEETTGILGRRWLGKADRCCGCRVQRRSISISIRTYAYPENITEHNSVPRY